MTFIRRYFLTLPLICLPLASLSYLPAHAEEQAATATVQKQQTMIVLDGSNSMWGKIGEKHKIELARSSIRTLVGEANNTIEFGLIAYGHRKKSSCQYIKTLSEPAATPREKLIETAEGIMPRGKSPVSQALTTAANQLDNHSGRILLVSDGVESCGGDPCKTAQQLTDKHPNLQIDVIGFNPAKEAQLECIAENGKGAFVLANDTKRLQTLLAGLKAQATPPITLTATTGDTVSTDKKAEVVNVDPTTPGTLSLRIAGTEDSPIQRANYFIYDENNTSVAHFIARKHVKEFLEPGTYTVRANWYQFSQTNTVTIKPGQQLEHEFQFGKTGILNLKASDGQQKPVQANYTVYKKTGEYVDSHILRQEITTPLPIGQYHIKARLGDFTQEKELEVSAGQQISHLFTFAE